MIQDFVKNKVSIVTPVYNGSAFIDRYMQSILSQTWDSLELILVDDGSDDDTMQKAEQWSERLKEKGIEFHLLSAEHNCAAAAISAGLPYVTGEYLIWPDSDDVLDPDSVRIRAEYLNEHADCKAVRSLADYFVDSEECNGEAVKPDEQQEIPEDGDLFWDILEGRTYVCCGCYMLRSSEFFQIYPQRRIPVYPVGQNFQMLLPYMYHHKCDTIHQALYHVAVRQGSHSRRTLSASEERRKYRYYEEMIDELSVLIPIKDQKEKDRISVWKLQRRYQLARKQKRALAMLVSGMLLKKYKEVHPLFELYTAFKNRMKRYLHGK